MTTTSLATALWPRTLEHGLAKLALVALGVALLALSAKVQVPFWPVPMTLQTAVVLVIGASCGARIAGSTLLAYLAAGIAGAPVFARGAGITYLTGPTGGYLVGFLLAALVIGWLSDIGFGRTIVKALTLMLVGELIIFALGVGWLAVLIGFDKAVAGGLVPFLPAEVLKVALAASLCTAGWSAVGRI